MNPLLAAALCVCVRVPESQGTKAPEDLPKVLVISGENNHDWRWTSPSLVNILEASGRFEVEFTDNPSARLAEPSSAADIDAFVLDYNGKAWGQPALGSCLHFLSRIGFINPTARRFFIECC